MRRLSFFEKPKFRYRRDIGVLRWSLSIIVCVVLVSAWSLLLTDKIRVAQVMSSSMEPTLKIGDRVIVSHIMPRRNLNRGDIITLTSPDDVGPPLVKRLVAIPGDVVEVREGIFYVNHEKSPPPDPTRNIHYYVDDFEIQLPPTMYFVLGDNRPFSHDSTEFGAIPENLILGKVLYRFGPKSDDE